MPPPLPDLVAYISRLPHARASFRQLVRELGARGVPRTELERELERLAGRGDLIEPRPGHYVVARLNREYATGRLSLHRDGFGFVTPETRIEAVAGDIYLPPRAAGRAMHGDRVLVRLGRIGPEGRAEGDIVRVLARAHRTVVGEFRVRAHGNYVIPHEDRIRARIAIPEGLERPPAEYAARDRVGAAPVPVAAVEDLDGMIVNVEILEYPEEGEKAVGRVVEILGRPDEFGVDVEILIRKHHIPHRFPEASLEEARGLPATIPPAEYARREDFRSLDVVTIDGETARDFDDAVWVDRLENGHYVLHVHIADVGWYVAAGGAIDREAFLRGTSVYFPDRAVPMLPLELSTDLCSLKPGVDRLVLSVLLEIDHHGEVTAQHFTRGVIRSLERLTYTTVHALLAGDDAELRARYARLLGRLRLMEELARVLNRKRVRRGSIDFDLPEPLIEFDQFGEMAGVTRAPRNIAHRLIEEFMLAANEAVAGRLESLGIPSLYRVHEPPDAQRVADFEQVAAQFGVSLGLGAIPVRRYPLVDRQRGGRKVRRDLVRVDAGPLAVPSRLYQKLIARVEGRPEERILSYLMLRSLKQARYAAENSGHYALAAPVYTHFTSPIRRYPDLVVHRVLARWLDGGAPDYDARTLAETAEVSSLTERRAAEAERELVEWKKLKFMAARLGEDFPALIISTTKFGFFVELEELFVEGLVPIETLPGDRFGYHENSRQIVGERSKRKFSIGDRVRVRLDRVDAVEKKLQFSLFEPERPGRRARRPAPGERGM